MLQRIECLSPSSFLQQAVKEAYEEFKRMGLEIAEPGIQVNYRPSAEDEKLCYEFGREFAKKAKEYHKKFDKGGI